MHSAQWRRFRNAMCLLLKPFVTRYSIRFLRKDFILNWHITQLLSLEREPLAACVGNEMVTGGLEVNRSQLVFAFLLYCDSPQLHNAIQILLREAMSEIYLLHLCISFMTGTVRFFRSRANSSWKVFSLMVHFSNLSFSNCTFFISNHFILRHSENFIMKRSGANAFSLAQLSDRNADLNRLTVNDSTADHHPSLCADFVLIVCSRF